MKKKLSLLLCFALIMGLFTTVELTAPVSANYDDFNWGTARGRDAAWLRSAAGTTLLNDILRWQRSDGGWTKPMDNSATSGTWSNSTVDNDETWSQIRILARGFNATNDTRYRDAAIRGINLFINGQYANGGWPLVFPTRGAINSYHGEITFNDGAMINIMIILRDAASRSGDFAWVDATLASRAQAAHDRGLECILRAQIRVGNTLTAWGQQHHRTTLAPVMGRDFEPAAIVSSESVAVVRFLRDHGLANPNAPNAREVAIAVNSAIAWFQATEIRGFVYSNRRLTAQAGAVGLWSRFYEIGTNRSIFGDRDGRVYFNLTDISQERQDGYAWYGTWGRNVINLGLLPVPNETPIPLLQGTLIRDLNRLDRANHTHWSIQTNAAVGNRIFGCDRAFTFASLPSEVRGAEWIRTSGNSKDFNANLAEFNAGAAITVYVGLDSRVATAHGVPAWLTSSGWTRTELTATTLEGTNTRTFQLYRRNFAQGARVTLGTNASSGSGVMMYTVFAVPQATAPVTTTTAVTTTTPPTTTTTTVATTTIPPTTTVGATTTLQVTTTTTPTAATTPSITTHTGNRCHGCGEWGGVNSTTELCSSCRAARTTTTPTAVTTTTSPVTTTTATTTTPTTTTTVRATTTIGTTTTTVGATTSAPPTTTTTTTTAEPEDILIGDVDDNGEVTIVDVLEILKYLAGLEDNIIKDDPNARNRALVLETSRASGEPTINDVLEILMALAGLESRVERLTRNIVDGDEN